MQSIDPLVIPRLLSIALSNAGCPEFYTSILRAFSELLPQADQYVLRYNSYYKPVLLNYEGDHHSAVDLYLSSLYKIDPFFQLCAKGSQQGVALLREYEGSSREFQNYFGFMSGVGIVENLSIMYPVIGGTTMVLAWDFLQEDFAVSDQLMSDLGDLYQITLAFHDAHLEALLNRPGHGLLDQNAHIPWMILSNSQDITCWSDNSTADDRAAARSYCIATTMTEGSTVINGATWHADRMSDNNAIAPSGWFIQKKPTPKFTGPRTFDDALQPLVNGGLTPREQDVVKFTLQGFSNQTIASKLSISHQVVKNYKASIYAKLDVTSERELFRRFLGIILEEDAHKI
ncbi:helix-turn-helix transcriptional regulator (plasmid) [Pseudohalocynthiibacter aestuariivivens]|nr:helix-turn-helix transcriptional regulator [Pseudohalocynthiibacter aestuariivivens]QIE48189.1 helix-turn-helix transcriptional regulator [Pseudohalocynthiibacter aestuariivivens]